jgi:hypothetical protein
MSVAPFSLERCPFCGAPDIVTHGEQVECIHCKKVMRLADLVPCPRCGEILPSLSATCEACGAAARPGA